MSDTIGAKVAIDGEKEFKAAVSGINKDLQVLGSEMKKVTAEFDGNADSMDALTAKQKVYTDQADAQTKKVDALKSALENAKKEFGENSDKVKSWQVSLNNAETDLLKTKKTLEDTTDQINNFGNETDQAGDELNQIGNNLDDAGNKAITFGDVLKANVIGNIIMDGLRNLSNAIQGLATDALNSADEIQQMADATGMSPEQIQEWQYAGDAVGTSIDTIIGAQAKLTKSMSGAKDGTGTQADAFKALGISVTDSAGNLRDAKSVMLEAFDALGGVGNETERDALAMDIFGKSAQDLNPLIKAGSDELKNLTDQAKNSGAVMSGETVAALDNFGDTMGQLKQSVTATVGSLMEKLLPSIQPIIDKIKDIDTQPIADFLSFIIDNAGTIAGGIAAIGIGFLAFQVVGMIQGLVGAFQAFKLAQEGSTVAQWAMNVAMSANPIGLIAAAIAGLVAGVIVLWQTNEGFRNAVIGIMDKIKETFSGVCKNISDGITGAVDTLVTLPGRMLEIGSNLVSSLWDGINNSIQWLKNNIPDVLWTIINGLNPLSWMMPDIGGNLVSGLWDGINGSIQWLKDKISGFAGTVTSAIKNFFGIHSPSKVFAEIGGNLSAGLAEGISGKAGLVTNAMNHINRDLSANANLSISGGSGSAQSSMFVANLILDSKLLGQATSKVQAQSNRGYSRALGVPA